MKKIHNLMKKRVSFYTILIGMVLANVGHIYLENHFPHAF